MTFKLPNKIPDLRTSIQDWADYAEYQAIHKEQISLLTLVKRPLMGSDEIEIDGIEDETDHYINKADEIAAEINYRIRITKGNYPFRLLDKDYSISRVVSNDVFYWVYKFLLLATRLKMTKDHLHKGINGTLLFEKLSGEIARCYFGDRAEVDVFGTSKSQVGGFRGKLATVITKLNEGGTVKVHSGHRPQDDNIDVMVWKGFSDKLSSQIIAFGQCKTGTSWRDRLTEMNTEVFCKTWFTSQPALTPVRMFFCAQYFPRNNWEPLAYSAGLVFDRFRIIDYLPEILETQLLEDIKLWVSSAELLYVN